MQYGISYKLTRHNVSLGRLCLSCYLIACYTFSCSIFAYYHPRKLRLFYIHVIIILYHERNRQFSVHSSQYLYIPNHSIMVLLRRYISRVWWSYIVRILARRTSRKKDFPRVLMCHALRPDVGVYLYPTLLIVIEN